MENKNKIIIGLIVVVFIAALVGIFIFINGKNQTNKLSEYFKGKEEIVAIKDIYTEQQEIDEEIKKYQKDSSYTLEKAKVMVNPYKISPLSALIIFKTKEEVSVTVSINGEEVTTTESSKEHSIPIYGLYNGYDNIVDLKTSDGKSASYTVTTDKLEVSDLTVNTTNAKLNNDLYFVTSTLGDPIVAYDKEGKLRWYITEKYYYAIEFLDNGHLLLGNGEQGTTFGIVSGLVEIDFLGKIYNQYILKSGYHHDLQVLSNGNFLVAGSNPEQNDTYYDYIAEIDKDTGEEVKSIDLFKIIQDIDSELADTLFSDWAWNNSIHLDEENNLLVVSLRDMNSVLEIDYNTSKLLWIFGNPDKWSDKFNDYFLKITDDSRYPLGQHSAFLTSDGNLGIFNNGYDAYQEDQIPCNQLINNYSSLVLYKLDGKNISTVWEYGKNDKYFSYALSNFEILDNGHKLANFGWEFSEESYHNSECIQLGNMDIYANIIELDENDELLFDATIKEGKYRVGKAKLYQDNTKNYTVLEYTKYDNTISSDYEIVKMSKLLDNLKNNNSMEVTMELTSTRLVLSYLFNPEDEVKIILIGENGDNYLYTYKEENKDAIPVLNLNSLKGKYLINLIINGEYIDINKVAVFE